MMTNLADLRTLASSTTTTSKTISTFPYVLENSIRGALQRFTSRVGEIQMSASLHAEAFWMQHRVSELKLGIAFIALPLLLILLEQPRMSGTSFSYKCIFMCVKWVAGLDFSCHGCNLRLPNIYSPAVWCIPLHQPSAVLIHADPDLPLIRHHRGRVPSPPVQHQRRRSLSAGHDSTQHIPGCSGGTAGFFDMYIVRPIESKQGARWSIRQHDKSKRSETFVGVSSVVSVVRRAPCRIRLAGVHFVRRAFSNTPVSAPQVCLAANPHDLPHSWA